MDLCKVADGTYDAYFEPHLHKWDVPAVSAGAVVVWEAAGASETVERRADPLASRERCRGVERLIGDELQPYLQ